MGGMGVVGNDADKHFDRVDRLKACLLPKLLNSVNHLVKRKSRMGYTRQHEKEREVKESRG